MRKRLENDKEWIKVTRERYGIKYRGERVEEMA